MSSFFKISDDQKKAFQISTLITSALGLVVALAWSGAISSLVDYYFPQGDSKNAWYKVGYAAVLTLIIAVGMQFF